MKWSIKQHTKGYSIYDDTLKAKKNGIRFTIEGDRRGNSDDCIVSCELIKDESVVLNSLWIHEKFKSTEEAQQWCEKFDGKKIVELREFGLSHPNYIKDMLR